MVGRKRRPYGAQLRDLPDNVGSEPMWCRLVNPWTGWWLAAFDPDAHQGLGEAVFTADPLLAMRFRNVAEVQALHAKQSTVMPVRDGRPNRPLQPVSLHVVKLPV